MPRQRHYVNPKEPGITVFITTTVLDFVHAFAREEPKTAMLRAIAEESRKSRAVLHAYVVMLHHVHLLVRLHEAMSVSRYMNILKRESSRALLPMLQPDERHALAQQSGLNGNTFWQRSFRAFEVATEPSFWQKVEYIHNNPVKAGYVQRAADYPWSSARLFEESMWTEEQGLPYDKVLKASGLGIAADEKLESIEA